MELKESKTNKHFYFSIIKSIVRIIGFIGLIMSLPITAGIILIIAECLGIIEEF